MYRYLYILIILLIGAIDFTATFTANAEEKYEDVTASVIVSSTFEVSADVVPIDFGLIDPGETVELYPDRYFNEVRCVSNNGRVWYLKAHCEDLQGAKSDISSTNLKFRVYWTNGDGYYSSDWTSFGDIPVLVYTSGGFDNMGREIKIQFAYKLEPPPGVPAGSYTAIVAYTMTELP